MLATAWQLLEAVGHARLAPLNALTFATKWRATCLRHCSCCLASGNKICVKGANNAPAAAGLATRSTLPAARNALHTHAICKALKNQWRATCERMSQRIHTRQIDAPATCGCLPLITVANNMYFTAESLPFAFARR